MMTSPAGPRFSARPPDKTEAIDVDPLGQDARREVADERNVIGVRIASPAGSEHAVVTRYIYIVAVGTEVVRSDGRDFSKTEGSDGRNADISVLGGLPPLLAHIPVKT